MEAVKYKLSVTYAAGNTQEHFGLDGPALYSASSAFLNDLIGLEGSGIARLVAETDPSTPEGVLVHGAPAESAVQAALDAEEAYLLEREKARHAASLDTFGHSGASIPSEAPDEHERVRRMLAAVGPDRLLYTKGMRAALTLLLEDPRVKGGAVPAAVLAEQMDGCQALIAGLEAHHRPGIPSDAEGRRQGIA